MNPFPKLFSGMALVVLATNAVAQPVAQQGYLKPSNTASNTEAWDAFAYSVAVSGETVVIGAPYESSGATGVNGSQGNAAPSSGAAYVFVRNGATWSQQAYLKASNTEQADRFGYSVAVAGDTIVVGALDEDSNATGVNGAQNNNFAMNSGAAYVFVRNGTNWSQQAYLKASNTGPDEQFGISVAVAGDTVVVGANREPSNATGVNGNPFNYSAPDAGAAYVFVRNGTAWSQQGYLKASNTEAGDQFGTIVSISGDTIAVGAPLESSNATGVNGNQADNSAFGAGATYVFVRNGTTWGQQAYLKGSSILPNNTFGASLSVSGDTVAVGTGANPRSGAVHVFVRNGITWMRQTAFTFLPGYLGARFGCSVAVSGETLIVGAYGEASSATGVNGNQFDTMAPGSGAAYLFVRNGTAWNRQAYLKASNTGADDAFGYAVGVAEGTVVVGAIQEDSHATGINGNQSDNSALSSGAAYVFGSPSTNAALASLTSSEGALTPACNPNITNYGVSVRKCCTPSRPRTKWMTNCRICARS